ncbi:MAG: FAD-binding oxidoreductase [Bacilli bacterium]|nr:FAD-binding oxidoreductase [Bacilli bacterium]MBN2877844.1 FAD-binding oxidoreductase [Bacilli bacterium]
MNKASIVIIGAGISGLSTAYNLAKNGMKDIVVIDKQYLNSGSTGRCGAGVRQQWGTKLNCILAKRSIEFFSTAKEELGYEKDIEFKQEGYLILSTSKEEDQIFAKNVKLQNSLGIPSRQLSVDEALEIVPHLNPKSFTSATFCKTDGHVNPFLMSEAYYLAAKRLGVKFYFFEEVKEIVVNDKQIQKVITDKQEIMTDKVLDAAGGYAKEVGLLAGIDIPVYSENHEILVTEPAKPMQGPMVMSFSKNIYCQQVPHGSFLMGRGNPDAPHSHDISSSWKFLDEMAKTVNHILPEVAKLRVIRTWGGSYNLSPDHQPIISDTEELPGFYIACGYSGHGFMFAPITGLLLSQMILKQPLEAYAKELHIDRFKNNTTTDFEHSVV